MVGAIPCLSPSPWCGKFFCYKRSCQCPPLWLHWSKQPAVSLASQDQRWGLELALVLGWHPPPAVNTQEPIEAKNNPKCMSCFKHVEDMWYLWRLHHDALLVTEPISSSQTTLQLSSISVKGYSGCSGALMPAVATVLTCFTWPGPSLPHSSHPTCQHRNIVKCISAIVSHICTFNCAQKSEPLKHLQLCRSNAFLMSAFKMNNGDTRRLLLPTWCHCGGMFMAWVLLCHADCDGDWSRDISISGQ